jgi:hypothetical protein
MGILRAGASKTLVIGTALTTYQKGPFMKHSEKLAPEVVWQAYIPALSLATLPSKIIVHAA